jgi:hypothetical protein
MLQQTVTVSFKVQWWYLAGVMRINMQHELPKSQMWRYDRKVRDHVEISWPAVVSMESLTSSFYHWMVYCAHHRHCTPTARYAVMYYHVRLYTNSHITPITVTKTLTTLCALMCSITILLNKWLITDITAKWELISKGALCYHVNHYNQR